MLAGNNPVTMIVNGTFRTAVGIIRGGDAFRLFKDSGVDLSNFTSDSRLNGCLLSASTCGVPLTDPGPGIRNLIDVLDYPGLGDTAPDDSDERSPHSGSAIVPPKIFLPKQPFSISQKIDEPVSGSGNPGLIVAGVGAGAAAVGGLLP
jgi:hypothetical protein